MTEETHRHEADGDALAPEERRALEALRVDREPPPDLEARVLGDVALIDARAGTAPARRPQTTIIAALAAAAVFAVGLWFGSALSRQPRAPAPAGSQFMLLLLEDDSFHVAANPADRVREYAAWARGLQGATLMAGHELGDGGVLLSPTSPPTRLPAADAASHPGGYFVIAAADEETAARIAATCPHLAHGGRILIKRVVGG